ncbi:DNL zinc finger-domain-containing protein [Apodospora peruviana]|uniref:DNL zinc finger-domain-containing protein n=1 Tax=Apodospora peruviana TaxID=516989 RepID=A0AAE0ISL7_9PEZI|nr:DNL zinc finger-domain-containing protein [Apodospora peruviana]
MAHNQALTILPSYITRLSSPVVTKAAAAVAVAGGRRRATATSRLLFSHQQRHHHALTAPPAAVRLRRQTPTNTLASSRLLLQLRSKHSGTPSLQDPVSDPNTPYNPATSPNAAHEQSLPPRDKPTYELRFTCKPCGHRSAHHVSKQGYHHGSVLIACPSCRNRHVISDHLRLFGDKAVSVEDILRERGQLVKKGTLGESDDLEFWEDGTTTIRREEMPEADRFAKPTRKESGNNNAAPGSTFKSVKPATEKAGDN